LPFLLRRGSSWGPCHCCRAHGCGAHGWHGCRGCAL
jgi:hypothetical protein